MANILLIIPGGIAAYKTLELIRLLRRGHHGVTAILTKAAENFVTPLSVQALTENKVYTDLWSLTDESEMGHIQLSRRADLLVVAPASADILARMATGRADDLASTVLLATDTPVLVAPAMNVRMWSHPATQANMATLCTRGIHTVGPDEGVMACNEYGYGRLAEPAAILTAIEVLLQPRTPEAHLLDGYHILVTSGPTHEPIDPVRYIANRSSGRQGHAIATALLARGARVTLVQGPVAFPPLPGATIVPVETAAQMLAACLAALPADAAVCAAAVADWHVDPALQKLKKGGATPTLTLVANPDILATLAVPGPARPRLVIGFAAETEHLVEHATAKRARKNADWMLANDVSPETGIMGGPHNEVTLITADGPEPWPRMTKEAVAARIADRIAATLNDSQFVPTSPAMRS